MSRSVDIKGFTYEIRKIVLYRPKSVFDIEGWRYDIEPNLIGTSNNFWKMIKATKLKFRKKAHNSVLDSNEIFAIKGYTSKIGHQVIRTANLYVPYALLNCDLVYETKRFGFIRQTWMWHTSRTYSFSFREKIVLEEEIPAWKEEAICAVTKLLKLKAVCERLHDKATEMEQIVENLDPERTIRDAHKRVKNALLDNNDKDD
jgi:hypothetical protein